jgi:hypothetical protein
MIESHGSSVWYARRSYVVVEKGAQPQKFVAAAVSYLIGQRQHAAFKGKGDISDSKKAYQSSGNGMPQTKRIVCGA